jgi:hypothetical protein
MAGPLPEDEGDTAADDTDVPEAVPAPHAAIRPATMTTAVTRRDPAEIGFTQVIIQPGLDGVGGQCRRDIESRGRAPLPIG